MSSFYLAGGNTTNPIPIGFLIPFQWFFPWCQAAHPYTCTNQFSTKDSGEPLCRSPERPPLPPLFPSPFLLCGSFSSTLSHRLYMFWHLWTSTLSPSTQPHPQMLGSPSRLQLTLASKLQPSQDSPYLSLFSQGWLSRAACRPISENCSTYFVQFSTC